MNFLLDTCILSELVKKTPNSQVADWMNAQQAECLFISSITIAEINKGLFKIQYSQPERYAALQNWLSKLETQFLHHTLPITEAILKRWSAISAQAEMKGNKLAVMDSLIAATALTHELTLVTRNVNDFHVESLMLVNPYHRN
jgi:predicted nucleic acid-binding protein